MSSTTEQNTRDYIQDLLNTHGLPSPGTIHVVRRGQKVAPENEPLDELFHAPSTVLMVIPQGGEWMDGHCYDAQGYEVYAD